MADQLLQRLITDLNAISGRDLFDAVVAMIVAIRMQGFAVAPFMTFAAPVPPWLPPGLPKPQIVQTRRQGTVDATPSSLFRSTFAFPRMPLAVLSALARIENDEWQSRHDMLPVPPSQAPDERARPGLFGHELEPNARLNELKSKAKVQALAGLLSDCDIAGDQAPSLLGQSLGFFGRFGRETVFDVRPAPSQPPPPHLRCHIERAQSPSTPRFPCHLAC